VRLNVPPDNAQSKSSAIFLVRLVTI